MTENGQSKNNFIRIELVFVFYVKINQIQNIKYDKNQVLKKPFPFEVGNGF